MSHDNPHNLHSRAVRAMAHLGLGGMLNKLISLSTTLILARLLTPHDYGVMALATIVVGFVGFFNEVGIGAAIVQKPTLEAPAVNGCFVVAVLASTLLFCLTALAAPLAADFFNTPALTGMIALLASGFLFGALGTVPQAFLRKQLHFRTLAGISFAGVVLQSAVSIAMAASGWGAWSLIYGFLASAALQAGLAYYSSSWRWTGPTDVRAARDLVLYGIHITTSRVFWYLYSNADKVLIGRLIGTRAVGIYDMAFGLASLPNEQITSLVTNVSSPLFARLQHDLEALNTTLLRLSRGIAALTYPVLLGMLAVSHELVQVLLGPAWLDVLIPFAALCLRGLVKSVDPLLSQILISTGHARRLSAYTALCGVVMSVAVAIGALADGLRGVALVWVVVYPLLTVRLLHEVAAITGLSLRAYYRNLLPAVLAATVMATLVYGVHELCSLAALRAGWALAIEIPCGALAYVLWTARMNRTLLRETRDVLRDLGIGEHWLRRWPFSLVEPQS